MTRWMIAALLAVAAVVSPTAQEADLARAPRMPMAEFKALHAAGGVLVVDVRDEASFTAGHIRGARSIPLARLLDPPALAELKSSRKPIVLYCA